jgi:hypothetical protein
MTDTQCGTHGQTYPSSYQEPFVDLILLMSLSSANVAGVLDRTARRRLTNSLCLSVLRKVQELLQRALIIDFALQSNRLA